MSSTDKTSETAIDTADPAAPASEDRSTTLDRAYDDCENPSTMTVFPADAKWPEIGTTWISVDVDHAVPASEYR
jgi:hypothetical protein